MTVEHIHFVTGRLAEHALRSVLQSLAADVGFEYSVGVMPITVAALMTPKWIARHLDPPDRATRILLPGYCQGPLDELTARVSQPVELGPRDLRQLPEFFGRKRGPDPDYGQWDIEILAEINHAPRLTLADIRDQARRLADEGADVIDVGCLPGDSWTGVGDCVKALRDDGHRVSIDSFDRHEVQWAVRAGAELVLSVNSTNREAAADWGCPVVAMPDEFSTLAGLDETVEHLTAAAVPFRLDPVLEPIGCGLAASLLRYLKVRQRYPSAEMMMGIGNLTELTDVDSAGVNVLLLGICQELGIRTVLTTQVINWARTSVRECDLARRLVHYAIRHGVPPKHLEPRLVTLRDPQTHAFGHEYLERLAEQVKDHNYRIFAEAGRLHLISAGQNLSDSDPFRLFQQLLATQPKNVDASHAFYLGYEMAKAVTALTLSKDYRQDEALDWGYLTVPEEIHRSGRSR
jgi:dihydropteroate synthase-like protein